MLYGEIPLNSIRISTLYSLLSKVIHLNSLSISLNFVRLVKRIQ